MTRVVRACYVRNWHTRYRRFAHDFLLLNFTEFHLYIFYAVYVFIIQY